MWWRPAEVVNYTLHNKYECWERVGCAFLRRWLRSTLKDEMASRGGRSAHLLRPTSCAPSGFSQTPSPPHSLCVATPTFLPFLQFAGLFLLRGFCTLIIPSAGKALSPDALRAYPLSPFGPLYRYSLARDFSCL